MAYNTFEYKSLCRVLIRHGYLLDSGENTFDELSADDRSRLMTKYLYSDMLTVQPLARTQQLIRDLQLQLIRDNQGFSLVTRTIEGVGTPLIEVADDDAFVFVLRRKHPYFPAITDLTDSTNRILLFANAQPDELPAFTDYLPLEADAIFADDTFLLSETDSKTLTDAWLDASQVTGVLGFIFLRPKGHEVASDFLQPDGSVKTNCPVFKIHFAAKRTYWKYIKRSTGFTAETTGTYPLTKNGFIEIDPATDFTVAPGLPESGYFYPNPSLDNFEFTLTKTYSVIFI